MAIEHSLEIEDGEAVLVLVKDGSPITPRSREQRLYENAWGCEFPDCDVIKLKVLTVDHFTPKCIARELGWRRKDIIADDNCQLLCEIHHKDKDRTTAQRYELVHQNGGVISKEEFFNSRVDSST